MTENLMLKRNIGQYTVFKCFNSEISIASVSKIQYGSGSNVHGENKHNFINQIKFILYTKPHVFLYINVL